MWIGIGCLGWLGLSYGYAWWYLREKEYAFGALIFWRMVAGGRDLPHHDLAVGSGDH
jgi:hypothetical protein